MQSVLDLQEGCAAVSVHPFDLAEVDDSHRIAVIIRAGVRRGRIRDEALVDVRLGHL